MVALIARYMDRYYLDPIIGFIFPTFGDILSATMTLPYLYISIFKIKSVALSLAIIYNTLTDIVISLIPFCIGDVLDIFNRSYKKNFRLIAGFLDDDKSVISEVNRKAGTTLVLIVLLCVIIVGLTYLTITLIGMSLDFLLGLFR